MVVLSFANPMTVMCAAILAKVCCHKSVFEGGLSEGEDEPYRPDSKSREEGPAD